MVGTCQLLAAMDAARGRKVVFSSSCSVYGEPSQMPIKSSQLLSPISPYGSTKLAGEQAIKNWSMARHLQYVILRYFNVAGTCSSGRLGYHLLRENRIIPIILRGVQQSTQQNFEVFGVDHPTHDGTCIRDFIHVSDLATAHGGALELMIASEDSWTLNLGSGRGSSVREVLDACELVTGCRVAINIVPKRIGEPSELICDSEGSWQLLRCNPERASINTMVRDSWKWIKNNC